MPGVLFSGLQTRDNAAWQDFFRIRPVGIRLADRAIFKWTTYAHTDY
jgi:hypothetical protein